MSAGDQEEIDLVVNVRRWLADLGADDALTMLGDIGEATPQGDWTVVVVGEGGAGKSSLVNSLLGEPDLLPAGPQGATGAYCLLRHGPGLSVHVHFADGTDVSAHDEVTAREWLGRYGTADSERACVWLEATHPDPRLAGLRIVDTPGVGGLDSAVGDLTMQSLRLAEALVFVTDCSAPLSRTELDFLREASARVDHVLVALTKVDGPAGWSKVADEDRRLLAEDDERFSALRLVPVSSKWAADASRVSRAELAARLRADSGMPAVWEWLLALAAARDASRESNRLRVAHLAVTLAYQERSRTRAIVEGGTVDTGELEEMRTRYEEWDRRADDWYLDVDLRSREISRELTAVLRKRSSALYAHFEDELGGGGKTDRERPVRELISAIADTEVDALEMLRRRIRETLDELSGGLDLPDEVVARLDELVGEAAGVVVERPTKRRHVDHAESITKTQTSYMGTMMTHTGLTAAGSLLGAAAAGPLGWLVAAVGGALWTWKGIKARKSAVDDATLLSWAYKGVDSAVGDIELDCQGRLDAAVKHMIVVLKRAYRSQLVRVQRELEEVERAVRMNEQQRASELDRLSGELGQLELMGAQVQRRIDRTAQLMPVLR